MKNKKEIVKNKGLNKIMKFDDFYGRKENYFSTQQSDGMQEMIEKGEGIDWQGIDDLPY